MFPWANVSVGVIHVFLSQCLYGCDSCFPGLMFVLV